MPQEELQKNTETIGTSGIYCLSGQVQKEYSADLKGLKGLNIYNQMYQSDGLNKGLIKAQFLPLLNATWYIEPSDPENEEAVLLAKKVENNLIHGIKTPWRRFLYQALLEYVYGFYLFEIKDKLVENPEEEEFAIQIDDLEPRHPTTITKWIHDDEGNLIEVQQEAYFNKGESSVWKVVKIPYDNCLHFINEPEAGNYTGTSDFRAKYKHWLIIKNIENIENVGIEKMALGTLVVEPPENYASLNTSQKADIDARAEEIIENWRAHRYAGVYAPYGMKIHIIEGKMNSQAIRQTVERHQNKSAISSLAGFILLTEGGSYALDKSKTSFFLQCLNGIAQDICDTISNQLIKRLVLLNDREVTKFPRLAVKNILFEKDEAVQEDKDQIEEEQMVSPVPSEEVTPLKKEGFSENYSPELLWKRTLTQAEKRVDFADIKKNMDTQEQKLQKEIASVTESQLKAIQKQIKAGKELTKITIPDLKKIEDIWTKRLIETMTLAGQGVGKEFKSKVNLDTKDIDKKAKEKAKLLTDKHKSDLMLEISNYYDGR